MRRFRTEAAPREVPRSGLRAQLAARIRVAVSDQPEAGSAVVEFIGLAVLLLVPLIYAIVALGQVQGGSYAAAGAADQAAKIYVQTKPVGDRAAAAKAAVNLTLRDFGIPQDRGAVSFSCSDGTCTTPGSLLTVNVRVSVPLPLVPSLLGNELSVATVDSTSVQAVSEYR